MQYGMVFEIGMVKPNRKCNAITAFQVILYVTIKNSI